MELFREGGIDFYAENVQLRKASVFYNPGREFDRCLNVLLVSSLGREGMSGLELFSGSGIRGLRLCRETGGFRSFDFNDLKSGGIIKKNLRKNKERLRVKTTVYGEDAEFFSSGTDYDYVDIDPFGSPVSYLDTAFSLLKKGGLLAVSATDTAALLGSAQGACRRKYGSRSLKTAYSNEIGIRILIKKVAEAAAGHSIRVIPLLFNFEGNFIRIYFATSRSAGKVLIRNAYQCSRCPARTVAMRKTCSHCGSAMIEIGPLWLGRIYDKNTVGRMIHTLDGNRTFFSESMRIRLLGYLNRLSSEANVFSYYTTSEISSFLKSPEAKISDFKNPTVLSPKGFRTKMRFSDLVKTDFRNA